MRLHKTRNVSPRSRAGAAVLRISAAVVLCAGLAACTANREKSVKGILEIPLASRVLYEALEDTEKSISHEAASVLKPLAEVIPPGEGFYLSNNEEFTMGVISVRLDKFPDKPGTIASRAFASRMRELLFPAKSSNV